MSNNQEDQILFAIGHLADSFARVERIISDVLSNLVNIKNPRIGQIVSDRLSLNQTVNLIYDLLKENGNDKVTNEFKMISKRIQEAANYRNDILHSTWATPSADDNIDFEIIQERARKRQINPRYHNLDQLLEKMEEGTFFIQDIEMELLRFFKNISNLIQQ